MGMRDLCTPTSAVRMSNLTVVKMASVGFRWLDILEKEFDKAFVDLDLAIGEFESEEPDVVFNVRQKLCTLSSCFAQLTHKAQTIFQNSAKIEAELIHMRAELVESKAKRELLEQELHNLLIQLHSSQLADTLNSRGKQEPKPDIKNIKKKLEAELRQQSPIHKIRISRESDELKFNSTILESAQCRAENAQLKFENNALRNSILGLNSQVYGAKLAAKYLDKELAGRIQQLQLLGREMRGEVRDKLWRQLESEILLQRHKTVVRACRRDKVCAKPDSNNLENNGCNSEHFGDIRTVVVKRKPNQGLGISITGGREHGVPILISELETNGPAALSEQLYIGDAILSVNDRDLRQACHKEAVDILQQQTGDCTLQVQYIAADDSDTSLEEDGYNFRFFNGEKCLENNTLINSAHSMDRMNTPTAPRTPEPSSAASRVLSRENGSPKTMEKLIILDSNETVDLNENNSETLVKDMNSNNSLGTIREAVVLIDNATQNIIKLEEFKKVDIIDLDDNLNCSTNSLTNSENFSSPMQTSTDIFLDSEMLSTDATSSHGSQQSPKNLMEINQMKPLQTQIYGSNDSLSNEGNSDQGLLNSGESSGASSPIHSKLNRDYKKIGQRMTKHHKNSRKYFGVKTLQSIFKNKNHDGYSDVDSSSGSEDGQPKLVAETTPQFEENIHSILSDIFVKNLPVSQSQSQSQLSGATFGTKKYFSLHGQNLRVGKALRLCPNIEDNEQRREKLLARYVYNANSINGEGVGDPDFGTPV